jgi:paraquat-inducible protein B
VAENLNEIPEAVAAPKSRRSVQLVWLIPLIAALVGGWLAVKSILDKGPVITISFKTAEGLEAGKTKLKCKDVEIGLVTKVELAKDLSGVIATAELTKGTGERLVEDTRFWVVRPRISGGSVSGLSTLLSGSYIGVGIGKSKTQHRNFVGLEVPPVFSTDEPGREFVLRSSNLGSLDFGSPVFFRRLQVGQISGYQLDKDGKGVTMQVFVNAPYDQYVTPNTRFWHASGIDVALDSTGIKIETQSVVSIVLGGIAFETPATAEVLPAAEQSTAFDLFENRTAAMKHPDTVVQRYMLVFNESLRGLEPGAVVDFRGIPIGEVVSINTKINIAKGEIDLPVEIKLFPDRLLARQTSGFTPGIVKRDPKASLNLLVGRGMRAQLRTGNLLTGQLYVALDFFPNAPKAQMNWDTDPPQIPVMAGSMEDLKTSITSVARKLDKVDYEAIGADLRQTLQTTNKLLQKIDAEIAPEARATFEEARKALTSANSALAPDSPVVQDTRATMQEVARAAQAFRILADYLERHPEALLSGKKEEKQ